MEVEGTEDIALNMEPLSGDSGSENLPDDLKHRLATDLLATISSAMEDKCFAKCMPKPAIPTDKTSERCFKYCMDHFMQAWNITSGTLSSIQGKMENKN